MKRQFAAAGSLLALVLLAGACSTVPQPEAAEATRTAPEVSPRGLPAQDLAAGECGLFLWSLSGDPTFVFFAKASTGGATMLIEDTPRDLRLRSTGGDVFGQFSSVQSWSVLSSGQTVDVALEPGEALLAGQQVPSGRLIVRDAEGWETIIPVSGVTACRDVSESPPPSRS